MSDKVGILRMQPSGCWAIERPGHDPVEITSGELFRVEVPGMRGLLTTRVEYRHQERNGTLVELAGYYSVDNYHLRDELLAAIGSGE